MTVLVDTPIWSLAYRREKRALSEQKIVDELGDLIRSQQAALIGPIRQEVLCGFSNPRQFTELRATLRAYTDLSLTTIDFELAAEIHHKCRRRGVQGSSVDFLICASALRHHAAVFTTDRDFHRYARIAGVGIYNPPR